MKYVKRQKFTHVEYVVRGLYNIPQLLYDALILRSITIANITMTSPVMQSCKCITFGTPAHPSDVRPPVMYGHFCLVPRVSVHDRYYCI